MRTLALCVLLGACAHPPAVKETAPDPHADLCTMVVASVRASLGTEDDTHLDEACVRTRAGVNGTIYSEAVGFDPMPVETITCKADKLTVTVGQTPPQAPSDMVVMVFFEAEHDRSRSFTTYVRYANWRKQPERFPMHACGMGNVDGVVRREGSRWVATTRPPD